MQRYARPYRRSCCGCAYRRKRKRSSAVPILIIGICGAILICIMPTWLLCALLGLALGIGIAILVCKNK